VALEDLHRILKTFNGQVLLDEAYYEFCGRTGMQFLSEFPAWSSRERFPRPWEWQVFA